MGAGWGGVHGVNKVDTKGTLRKESREFEGGGFAVDYRGRKDGRFGWGR